MSYTLYEVMPRYHLPTGADTSISPKKKKAIPQNHNPSPILLKALPGSSHASATEAELVCPLLGCPSVFGGGGGTLHRYL